MHTDQGSNAADTAKRTLSLIDLTELSNDCDELSIQRLCSSAVDPLGSVAAVCVWPRHVFLATQLLHGTSMPVATVVNFPLGTSGQGDVLRETEQALTDGASEIDLVLPWRALLAGDTVSAQAMVQSVRTLVGPAILLKVILETGCLPDRPSMVHAAELSIAGGADFLKTSTGKTEVSATLDAVSTLLEVISGATRVIGLKPSGGIKTLHQAEQYLGLVDTAMGLDWATPRTLRFGASSLHADVMSVLRSPPAGRLVLPS